MRAWLKQDAPLSQVVARARRWWVGMEEERLSGAQVLANVQADKLKPPGNFRHLRDPSLPAKRSPGALEP